jgi:myo-inositol-1(or 4)-monophosphatase
MTRAMVGSFREVAVEAARRAGALLATRDGRPLRVARKSSSINLVTEMDRRAECLIVELLRSHFPDHSILAEESGLAEACAGYRWVIDPLDGTTNYVHGLPLYGVSIALEAEGEIVLGVVYDPNRRECFVAERGRGATLDGRPMRVSATATLDESLLATGFPYDIRETARTNLPEHAAFSRRCQVVRELGSAALSLAAVAAGRLDGYWELSLGPWDLAAGALLVVEAGGRVSAPGGEPIDWSRPDVVASNGVIHGEMLSTLREGRAR